MRITNHGWQCLIFVFKNYSIFCLQTVNVSMACAMKVLMEMEDVIASMVGKDSFAISVSIVIKNVHRAVR